MSAFDFLGSWKGYGRPGPALTHDLEYALTAICRDYSQRDQAGTRASLSMCERYVASYEIPAASRDLVAAAVMAKLDDIASRKGDWWLA